MFCSLPPSFILSLHIILVICDFMLFVLHTALDSFACSLYRYPSILGQEPLIQRVSFGGAPVRLPWHIVLQLPCRVPILQDLFSNIFLLTEVF